ncbi:acyltransferase family protein [Acidithiobacillus thiooxidans]|uniref:Putative O-acetyltransferase n=2 Tax=Acidithiobacillus thiooxidans TaxID=930 RepID=A0A543Q811_ACITH|nr:acyltransferase family protein [Acidithiobacillus thiooxidans]TQN52444.1 putative O-acetyltransferase [Acidithiobacillus thiooxidans ATCC 19377]
MLYLDYLKFLAMVGVIGFHVHETITFGSAWFSGGYLGVDVFLFVSGYLIERSMRHAPDAGFLNSVRTFFRRRLSRIVIPMLVVTWVVALFGYYFHLTSWQPAVYSSLFVYNFYLIFHHIPYFQTFAMPHPFIGMWFISLLVQLYVLHFLLRKIIRNQYFYFVLMLLLLMVTAGGAYWLGVHHQLNAAYVLPWHGFSYIAGILGFMVLSGREAKKIPVVFDLLVVMAVLGIIVLLLLAPYQNYVIYSLPVLLLTAIYIYAAERSTVFAQMKWQLGGALGEMSYSLYLWNVPVISFLYYFYHGATDYVLVILSVLIILLLSVLTYALVEVSIQNAFGKKARHHFSLQTAFTVALILGLGIAGWYDSVVVNQQFIHEREKNLHLLLYKHYQALKIAQLQKQLLAIRQSGNAVLAEPAGNALSARGATSAPAAGSMTWQPNPQPGYLYNGQEIRQNRAYPDKQVLVVTDSILLGWSGFVIHQVPNAILDGKVGRQFSRAPSVLQAELTQPQNADIRYIVLELGSNGDVFTQDLDRVMREAGNRKVMLIIPNVPRVWENEVKAQYLRAKAQYPNVYLLHWNRISHDQYNYFDPDQVHLTWDGAQALVNAMLGKLYTMGYQQPQPVAHAQSVQSGQAHLVATKPLKSSTAITTSTQPATAPARSVAVQPQTQSPLPTTRIKSFTIAPLSTASTASVVSNAVPLQRQNTDTSGLDGFQN